MRRLLYISGTRADFGLMASTLRLLDAHSAISLGVVVTGMHLSPHFGSTVKEIEATGLEIAARVPVDVDSAGSAAMARACAAMMAGFVDVFEAQQPDAVLLLGDRGEMIAAALAALHLNIPIFHIHGGERSGTIDESIRHATSKLAHYHLVATQESAQRLARLGEEPERIILVGAPGLDGLVDLASKSRAEICLEHGFDTEAPVALVVFHPVVQELEAVGDQTIAVLRALQANAIQALMLMPNSDAGRHRITAVLDEWRDRPWLRLLRHLPRQDFVSAMAAADVMVGNSSSGIIEAASFGVPVVNIGSRQNLRERNVNVIDVPPDEHAIGAALRRCMEEERVHVENVYGDGRAGERIVAAIAEARLGKNLLSKALTY